MAVNTLSNAEANVFRLILRGQSNKEIAAALNIAEKTVKFHNTRIYKKLGVKSRSQLLVRCLATDMRSDVPNATAV